MSARLAAGVGAELSAGTVSRLAGLQRAAIGFRGPGEVAQIREDLLQVLGMWRRLLAAHQPVGGDGRCPACPGWWRRHRWPCRVWTAAHTVLIALEGPVGIPAQTAPRSGVRGASRPGVRARSRHARPGHRLGGA